MKFVGMQQRPCLDQSCLFRRKLTCKNIAVEVNFCLAAAVTRMKVRRMMLPALFKVHADNNTIETRDNWHWRKLLSILELKYASSKLIIA